MARIPEVQYEELDERQKKAYDEQVQKSGSVTNMKKVLLQSYDAYAAYMGWYDLYDKMNAFLGTRSSMIFCHSISTTNGCLLCSLYFIKDLRELGEDPNTLKLDDKEQALSDLGQQMVKDPNGVSDELFARLKQHFTDEQVVLLVAFAGFMIAYNAFNCVMDIDVDEKLIPYRQEFKNETWRDK